MQYNEAKEILISTIVEHLGGRYSHTDAHGDIWYFSVFRPNETTASFKINTKTNKWYDFGLTGIIKGQTKSYSGGDGLDLLNDFHHRDRRAGIPQSLAELARLSPRSTSARNHPVKKPDMAVPIPKPPRYKILKIQDKITHQGLKDELYRRRISKRLAEIYLKQGYIQDTVTGKNYTGFLFQNDEQGYEVSIPNPSKGECFKTCIGSKSSTAIKPPNDFNAIDAFEGFWDFLSWLEIKKILFPINYTLVLNSVSFTGEVSEKILSLKEQVTSVFLFMDNDLAGEAATHEFALLLEPVMQRVGDMRESYTGYKDLGKFREHKNSLTTRPSHG
jgi:hypothetical protein